MRRDIFKRGNRMVHKFGETEKIGESRFFGPAESFEPKFPVFPQQRSGPITSKQQGEHEVFMPPRSPIEKFRGGLADFSGPAPDMAEAIGAPISTGTKKRVNHLKTDK